MKTWTLRLVKIFAGLAAVLLVLHTVLLIASGLALRNAREELRAAGHPMTLEEIIPKEVPPSENAAPLYQSAFALLNSETIAGKKLTFFVADAGREFSMDPDSEDKRLAFEQALANETVVQAFNLIQQAAARPRCNFDLPYDQGALMLFPHVNGLLSAGRILWPKILLESRRGEEKAAWQSVDLSLRIANALRDEPVLISALVRFSLCQSALISVRKIAESFPPDDETTARLTPLIAAADDLQPILLGFNGERLYFGEWLFDQNNAQRLIQTMLDVGGPDLKPRHLAWLISYRPSRQFQHAAYLRVLKQSIDNLSLPLEVSPSAPESNPSMQNRWYGGVLHSFAPSYFRARVSTLKLRAHARITQIGLALLRHKAALGSYPASLAEIDSAFLPKIPLDPFTGQPLVYRPDGDGFLLYSLGENLADDGGTEESTDNNKSKAFDIVWRMSH